MNTMFITGAAMGIGRATAEYFYHRGWTLGLADLDLTALKAFSEGKDPKRVHCYKADVTSPKQVSNAINKFCEAHQNQLTVLINNAGWLKVGAFESLTLEEHHKTVDINVNGVLNCLYAAFTYLKQTPDALVINLSSASSNYGVPEFSSYSATKFAVKALTESLEIEWKKYDIRVCDIVPPFVNTPMLQSQEVEAKATQNLGTHLVAGDVVNTIVKQIENPIVHRPVGWRYGILHHLSSIAPHFLQRWLMLLISR